MNERNRRWRLILGDGSEKCGDLDAEDARRSQALSFLYDRERGGQGSVGRGADLSPSTLTVPEWINEVHELFPVQVRDVLETDALERYEITEMVTNEELLERVEPSESLLRAILATKHLMSDEVLSAARRIIEVVVRQLLEKFTPTIQRTLLGRRDPVRRSRFKVASNFDARATIRANLKHVNPATGGIIIKEPLFSSRTRPQSERWQVVVTVDQSGSMAASVIYSAITAAIFYSMPILDTRLVVFDTSVVDLTSQISDPVETLLGVQLGGGTDIGKAMHYAESLIEVPRRSIVVLITDLFEGGVDRVLIDAVKRLVAQGTKVMILGALDADGTANYNRELGSVLHMVGAEVGAMTPDQLADWVGQVIG